MSNSQDNLENLSVNELINTRESISKNIENKTVAIAELRENLKSVNREIFIRTPRDLSINEIQRLLGFKINIVDKDKLKLITEVNREDKL